jgi:hypothetical protein
MTLQWIVTGVSLLIALVACWLAWRTSRRLEQLSQQYWELKYLNGELRVKLQHLTGEPPPESAARTEAQARDSFVPLSSLKR